MSAAFSAIMIVGALVFPRVTVGITDAQPLKTATDAMITRSVRREHVQDGLAGDLAVE